MEDGVLCCLARLPAATTAEIEMDRWRIEFIFKQLNCA
jgi:hypothetical protein